MSRLATFPTLARLPQMASAPPRTSSAPPKDRRQSGRITIDELNRFGADALKNHLNQTAKPEDTRPWYVRVLDAIDLPRNVVANIIADIAGMNPQELSEGQRGAVGLPKIFMSSVLRKLGVQNKVVRGVLGFAGDVAIDPMTYLSLGASTGMNLGKGAPKMLRPGREALETLAMTGEAAPGVAEAVGLTAQKAAKWAGRQAGRKSEEYIPKVMSRLQTFLGRSPAKTAKSLAAGTEQAAQMAAVQGRRAMQLVSKRGGLLPQRVARLATEPISRTPQAEAALTAARQFFQRYGEKGRTIARLPFAASGITAKVGKRAQLYKDLLKPEVLQNLMAQAGEKGIGRKALGDIIKTSTLASQISKASQELADLKKQQDLATEPGQKLLGTLQKKFQVSPKAAGVIQRAATGEGDLSGQIAAKHDELVNLIRTAIGQSRKVTPANLPKRITQAQGKLSSALEKLQETRQMARGRQIGLATSPDAPWGVKAITQGEIGKPASSAWQGLKQEYFGPGASPMHQRAVALENKATSGAQSVAYRMAKDFQKEGQPIVREWAARLGTNGDDVYSRVIALIESDYGKALDKFAKDYPIRLLVQQSIESGLAKDPAVRNFADKYSSLMQDLYGQMQKAGVAPGEFSNYFHRVATPEYARAAAKQARRFPDTSWTRPRVTAYQTYDEAGKPVLKYPLLSSSEADMTTLKAMEKEGYKFRKGDISQAQWNKWSIDPNAPGKARRDVDYIGTQFSNDVAQSVYSSVARTEQLKAAAGARDLAMETGAKIPAHTLRTSKLFRGLSQPEIPTDSPFYQTVGKQLEGYAFPRPVSDMLTRFFKVTHNQKGVGRLLKATDIVQGYWKGQALFHHAYTIRNTFQNLFGCLMSGGNPLRVAQLSVSKPIRQLVKDVELGRTLTGTIRIGDREIPAMALAMQGKLYNMFNAGFTSQIAAETFQHPESIIGVAKGAARVGKRGVDKLFLAWHRMNNTVETTMRVATWVHFMETGMNPRMAAMRTILAMPDLTDMSLFEKNVVARVLPWARWIRRNGALQLFHYLPNKPAFFAGQEKLLNLVQDTLVDRPVRDDLRPEWMRESLGAQITGNQELGAVFLLASWLPFQELADLMSGAFNLGELPRLIINNARPELKFLAEMGVGQDIFRRTPVEPFSLKDLVTKAYKAPWGGTGTPLDNLLTIRAAREIRRVGEQPTTGGKALRLALGGAVQSISRQRGLYAEYTRLRDKAQLLRSKINAALRTGNKGEAEALQRQLIQALLRMYSLGLPGVPKSTQKVFATAKMPKGESPFE